MCACLVRPLLVCLFVTIIVFVFIINGQSTDHGIHHHDDAAADGDDDDDGYEDNEGDNEEEEDGDEKGDQCAVETSESW